MKGVLRAVKPREEGLSKNIKPMRPEPLYLQHNELR